MKTIPKAKQKQMQMILLKFLGIMEILKQSTCIRLDISPNLNVLLQRTEYFIALFTMLIETQFDISVPTKLSV